MIDKGSILSDIKILYKDNQIFDFWPNTKQTHVQKLNSIIRFIFICGIVLSIYNKNTIGFIVSLVTIILLYVLTKRKLIPKQKTKKIKATKSKITCRQSTRNNPFSNYIWGVTNDDLQACKYEDVKNKIEKNFDKDLYKNVLDIYDREHSQRQFYTMPSTSYVNDQSKYAEWLYGNKFDDTCKTNHKLCSGNEVGGGSSGFGAGKG